MSFKVGDHVVVYGAVKNQYGSADFLRRQKATVVKIISDDEIEVKISANFSYVVHHKQCRKLVKKERRRIWVNPNPTPEGIVWRHCPSNNFVALNNPPGCGWIEFIEARKRK